MSGNESRGYMPLLYSIADRPLDLWSKHVCLGGRVRRIRDDTLHGDQVIEITGSHKSTIPTNIATPAGALDVLNARLPVLVLVIRNLNLRFKFEVQITDEKQYRRRFSFMTYNLDKLPSIGANVARIPLKLDECWNLLEIDLRALCRDAYGADYEALQRLIIYPNCHLRRVYLQDRRYSQDEIPVDIYRVLVDTYMSKWRRNSIDGECQTEKKDSAGFPQSKLAHHPVRDNVTDVPLTEAHLSKNAYSMGKLENLNSPNITTNLNNLNALKRNYTSLDILHNAIKLHDKQSVAKKQSEYFAESLISDLIAEYKTKDDNNNKEK